MKEGTLRDFKQAIATGINRPLLVYYEERLQDAMQGLLVANEETFKQNQGRCLELQELIKLIKSIRE
jgi:hypothetical protein